MKDEFKRARQTRHWMGRKRAGKIIGNRMARSQVQRDSAIRIVLAGQEAQDDEDWEEGQMWKEMNLDDEREMWNIP